MNRPTVRLGALTCSESVSLPHLEAPAFTAYSGGERWNGFRCPRFLREEADRVVAAVEASVGPGVLTYDEASDAYLYHAPGDQEPHVFEGHPSRLPDGEGAIVYAIGAWCWCWTAAAAAS